jgi:PilZ domain
MYVKLGSGNGGILLNLGVGGLAFQAAGKLNRHDDLTLCFQLVGTKQAIEVRGRVAWLGLTQKEAGVCFKDLSADLQQVISDWIVDQDRTPVVEVSGQQAPEPIRAKNKTLAFSSENQARTSVLKTPRTEPRSNAAAENESEQRLLPIGSSSPQRDSIPRDQSGESFGVPAKIPFDPSSLRHFPAASISPGEFAVRNEVLRESPRPVVEAVSGRLQISSVFSSWINRGRHRRLGLQIFGVCLVILVLTLTAKLSLTSRRPSGAGHPRATVQEVLRPANDGGSSSQHPEVLPQNTAEPPMASTGSAQQPSAPPASGDIIATPAAPADWASLLKKMFFGAEEKAKMDPTLIGLPVWTVKQNGFYYCSDSRNFGKLEPGIWMTQGQALQSGYQPVTGSYCH